MFRTVPLSIIRSERPDPACKLSANLYDITLLCVQWKTPDDGQRNCPKHAEFERPDPACKAVSKPVWHIPLLCVQQKTPDDGQRNCPKHVEFERPDPACKAVSKPVWRIPLLCVQWKTPDDGQRNCTKHVEFYSKNKFEKLVHLVGFIIRLFAWSMESVMMLYSHDNNEKKCAWNEVTHTD